MLSLTDLLTVALATLYLSYALTKTKGAFGMFDWIREHLALGGLTKCLVCAAFWIGLGFYALWALGAGAVVQVVAVAGVAVAVGNYVGLNQT